MNEKDKLRGEGNELLGKVREFRYKFWKVACQVAGHEFLTVHAAEDWWADQIEEIPKDLPDPRRSEVQKLLEAAQAIVAGNYAEATIKLQVFVATWRVHHREYPLLVTPETEPREDNRPPTEKQKEFVRKVAIYTGVKPPEKATRSACSHYLDEHAPEYYRLMAEARESGRPMEPKLTDAEVDGKSGASCSAGSGSSGCKRCQDHQKESAEKHKDDPEGDYLDEMPF